LFFLVAIAAVFWLMLIRPQRRRQQELAATQQTVQLGDEVMLGAGIFGVVTDADDEVVELEVTSGARMKVARAAVVRILTPDVAESAEPDPPTDLQGPPGATPEH
jgi:preprotein translocase subunit YajC